MRPALGRSWRRTPFTASRPRRNGAFVARNAATLPAALLDAELFGSARNYPNPARRSAPGFVGAADGGMLFVDEIGELPALVEVLLRHDYALQTRELERLLQLSIKTSPTDYLTVTPELLRELSGSEDPRKSPRASDAEEERDQIARALSDADGKITVAAERLGKSRHALRRLLQSNPSTDDV